MRRQQSVAAQVYSHLYPTPGPQDPPDFSQYLIRHLITEVRIETQRFYGGLDTIEAKYPGLNYSHPPHRKRLGRFPNHARLFRAFDDLGLTAYEISELCKWEGTLWARQRYERDEKITVQDTTANEIKHYVERRPELVSRRSPRAISRSPSRPRELKAQADTSSIIYSKDLSRYCQHVSWTSGLHRAASPSSRYQTVPWGVRWTLQPHHSHPARRSQAASRRSSQPRPDQMLPINSTPETNVTETADILMPDVLSVDPFSPTPSLIRDSSFSPESSSDCTSGDELAGESHGQPTLLNEPAIVDTLGDCTADSIVVESLEQSVYKDDLESAPYLAMNRVQATGLS